MSRRWPSALSAGLLALTATSAYSTAPLGANLLPEGDFEAWSNGFPVGWTAAADKGSCVPCSTSRATGQLSAELRIPAGLGAMRLVSHDVAAGEGAYLARFMMRVDGLSRSQSFEGGQAGMFVQWLDAGKRVLRTDYVAWSYITADLAYHDQIFQAPGGTAHIRVTLEIYGHATMPLTSAVWFDDVAVCPYEPPRGIGDKAFSEWSVTDGRNVLRTPDAPSWSYLAGVEPGQGGGVVQAERVRDGAALFGSALHTRPGVPPGMVYHTAYTVEQPPGLYRVFVRARIPPQPAVKPDAPILMADALHSSAGYRGRRPIRAVDFRQPGNYEELSFDFVKPTTGWVAYRIATPGQDVESWLDCIRVVQLMRFRDPDLLQWYPGLAGALDAPTALAPTRPPRVLLVEGLAGERYRCSDVARAKGWPVTALRTALPQGGAAIHDFPAVWQDLIGYRLVILANASLEGLGPEQRCQLRRFVEIGGGLLLLGGKSAFGNGGLRGSFLEDVLPVRVADTRFDIVPNPAFAACKLCPDGLALSVVNRMAVPYVHDAVAHLSAQVRMVAGARPLLVTGTFGRGRCACFLGTPYGAAPRKGDGLLTESDDWPTMAGKVMDWLLEGSGQ